MKNYYFLVLNAIKEISFEYKKTFFANLPKDCELETDKEFTDLFKYITKQNLSLDSYDEIKKDAESIIKDCEDNFVNIISYDNDYYPNNLRLIDHSPFILFHQGSKEALTKKMIALVGRRDPSESGQKMMKWFAEECVKNNYVVVSGLAKGSDMYAHQGALDANGITVGVLPIGLPHITPSSNSKLATDITKNGGCLLSVHPPKKKRPFPSDYTDRNGIITAISTGVFVLEANDRGGSLNAFDWAIAQKKHVACFFPKDFKKLAPGNKKMKKLGAQTLTTYKDVEKFFTILSSK